MNSTNTEPLIQKLQKQDFVGISLLIKQNINLVEPLIDLLFEKLGVSDSKNYENINVSGIVPGFLLKCCTFIITEDDPNAYFSKLKQNTKPRVCTQVWNDGYYFYRCKNCETSPSSSICYDCFQHGDHKGHDFRLEVSVFGGCCDCGNSDAWKPTGFCKVHTGSFGEDPSNIIPANLRDITRKVFHCLTEKLASLLPTDSSSASSWNKDKKALTLALVSWIRQVAGISEALLHLIRLEMVPPTITADSPVAKLLNACLFIPEALLNEILFLFLDVLQDPMAKKNFVEYYVSAYPKFLGFTSETRNETGVVYKISPQLFSIPGIVIPLAKEGKLLSILVESLYNFFFSLNKASGLPMVTDWDNPIIADQNYYAFTSDLHTIFSVAPEICHILVTQQPQVLKRFIEMMALVQGCDPLVRKADVHVEYDSDSWRGAFSLEAELSRIVATVIDGFLEVVLKDLSDPNANINNNSASKSLSEIQHFTLVIGSALESWIAANDFNIVFKESLSQTGTFETLQFDVGSGTVSFHLMLHRWLARLVKETVKNFPNVPLEAICCLKQFSPDFKLKFFEQPLHLQVVASQVRADWWVRNGLAIYNDVYVYKGNHFMDNFCSDMFLLQCAAVLLGPNHFMDIIVDRFNLKEWFSTVTKPAVQLESPEVGWNSKLNLVLVEDFFKLIINLVTDRTKTGASSKEILRREIIHVLALDDLTHSKVMSELSNRLQESKELVEEVLSEVANYKAPSNSVPGTYSLKKNLWKEFDPYFPRYDVHHLQVAMERFQPNRPKAHPAMVLPPLYPQFVELLGLLRSPWLHFCLYSALNTGLQHLSSCEPILIACFHLILIILDNPGTLSELPAQPWFSSTDFVKNVNQKLPYGEHTILSMLIALYQKQSSEDFTRYLQPILSRLSAADSKCKQLIFAALPEFDESGRLKESNDENWRKKSRERQAAILLNFSQEQRKFLQTSQQGTDEDNSGVEDDYVTMDTGKLCALCRSGDLPEQRLSLISLMMPSKILHIAKTQDLGNNPISPAWPFKQGNLKAPGEKKSAPVSLLESLDSSATEWMQKDAPAKTPMESDQEDMEDYQDATPPSEPEEPPQQSETSAATTDESGTSPSIFGSLLAALSQRREKNKEADAKKEGSSSKLLFHNIDEATGISVQSCGHCMHPDCFQSFFESLANQYHQNQLTQRHNPTDVEKGEFFCPVCRRLSNTLVPLVPETSPPVDNPNTMTISDLVEKMPFLYAIVNISNLSSSIQNTNNNTHITLQPSSAPTVDRRVLKALSHRLYCIQHDVPISTLLLDDEESFLHLFNYTCSAIASLEVVTRHIITSAPSLDHTISCIRSLALSIIGSSVSDIKRTIFDTLAGALCATKIKPDKPPTKEQLLSKPVLQAELFDLLCKCVFTWPDTLSQPTYHILVQLVATAQVVQALAMSIKKNTITSNNNNNTNNQGSISTSNSLREAVQRIYIELFPEDPSPQSKVSQYLSSDFLSECESLCISFLRRAYILDILIFGTPATLMEQALYAEIPQEYEELINHFGIASLDTLFDVAPISSLLNGWIEHYNQFQKQSSAPITFPKLAAIKATDFIKLPGNFQDILLGFVDVKCPQCNTVPKQGAICLLCGAIVCVGSKCCFKDIGEAYKHSKSCNGVFLMLKLTSTLILRGDRRSLYQSPYVDERGEEDTNLKRGKPIYLDEGRLNSLRYLWLTQSFDYDSKIQAATLRDALLL